MKKLFAIFFAVLVVIGCGDSSASSSSDSVAGPVAKSKGDSIVMHGSGAVYAYRPDSMYNDLVIGSISSFRKFWLKEGAEIFKETDSSWYCVYITNGDFERVTVGLVKNAKNEIIPYSIDIRKYHDEKFNEPVKALYSIEHHFLSEHGIYIGMSPEYVKTVYTDQKFKYSKIGDTVCLEYHPEAKDASEYKRYTYSSVTAKYKFVDDYLRRIEYTVNPKGFINTK